MSAQGHLQQAAQAAVDVMSAEAMLRASQEEFTAAAIQKDGERMADARNRAHKQLDALLNHVGRQQFAMRDALLASGDENG